MPGPVLADDSLPDDATSAGSSGWCVLWDMDGTLVDTEPYWIAGEYELVESLGGSWSDDHARALVGRDLLDAGSYIREHAGLPLEPVEIVDRLLDRVIAQMAAEILWRPGARTLLSALHAAEVPCALVTMSWRRCVEPVLLALPAGSFAVTVTGDELPVGRGKPKPDSYLRAAAALGTTPERCVAIEDSPTGARAALAAGCGAVVGVPNVVSLDLDGVIIRPTLDGVTPAELGGLLAATAAAAAPLVT